MIILSTSSVELHCEVLRSEMCLINSLFQAIASPKSASALHTLCEVTDVGGAKECISGSMRYITSSYMALAFGSRPPWSSLHGLGEDSTASPNIRVLRPKTE